MAERTEDLVRRVMDFREEVTSVGAVYDEVKGQLERHAEALYVVIGNTPFEWEGRLFRLVRQRGVVHVRKEAGNP